MRCVSVSQFHSRRTYASRALGRTGGDGRARGRGRGRARTLPEIGSAPASVAAATPAVGGLAVGTRRRERVSERLRRGVVLGLLVLIGIRSILGVAGVVWPVSLTGNEPYRHVHSDIDAS